jgi:hypothetical protein
MSVLGLLFVMIPVVIAVVLNFTGGLEPPTET